MATPQQALATAQERWNAGDLDGYLRLYHDDVVLHGYGEPLVGPALHAFYQGIWVAFADPHLEFHEVLWSGDACTIRFTLTGRHVGEFMGVPATGRDIALLGITILRFDGDRCRERWSSADMFGLLVQLGAVPAPA